MVLFPNISPRPKTLFCKWVLKMANRMSAYFSDNVPFEVFFNEDGRMKHVTFMEVIMNVGFELLRFCIDHLFLNIFH